MLFILYTQFRDTLYIVGQKCFFDISIKGNQHQLMYKNKIVNNVKDISLFYSNKQLIFIEDFF